jgi:hypothetical protein
MRFEKPKKSGRPDFAAGRIAELERQLATETNETRKSELRNEINEWQRSRPVEVKTATERDNVLGLPPKAKICELRGLSKPRS